MWLKERIVSASGPVLNTLNFIFFPLLLHETSNNKLQKKQQTQKQREWSLAYENVEEGRRRT